jgi:hypothetical protein
MHLTKSELCSRGGWQKRLLQRTRDNTIERTPRYFRVRLPYFGTAVSNGNEETGAARRAGASWSRGLGFCGSRRWR